MKAGKNGSDDSTAGSRVITRPRANAFETESDRAQMFDAGCDYGEGFLFGPVRPAGDVD